MADVDALNTTLRAFIRELMGMPVNSVRPANQVAPTGLQSEQFATVLIASLVPIAQSQGAMATLANEALPSTNVRETVRVQFEALVSVQFFKGDAFTKAQRLAVRLFSSWATDTMQTLGLGLVDVSSPRNLTGQVDTFWEARGQLDLRIIVLAEEVMSLATYQTFTVAVSHMQPLSTTTSEVIAP